MAAAILSPRYDKPLPLIPLAPRVPSGLIPAPLSPTKLHGPTHIVHQFEAATHHRRLRSYSPTSNFERAKIFRRETDPYYGSPKVPRLRTPRQKPSIERMQLNRIRERAVTPIDHDDASIVYAELPGSEVPYSDPLGEMLQTTELPGFSDRPPTYTSTETYIDDTPGQWSIDSSIPRVHRQESHVALRGPPLIESSPRPLRISKSIPEKLSSRYEHRNFSAPTYTRPNRGYTTREARVPSPPRRHPLHTGYRAAEVRPSFYSNLTNGSSVNDTTTTDRSSVMTGHSGQSDLPKVVGSRPQTAYGEEMSVEDAIAMYIEGFETDREIEKQVEEEPQEEPQESQDYIVPGDFEIPAALQVQKKSSAVNHAHRRSKSLSVLERSPQIPQRPSTAKNLTVPPPGPVLRSSTQVVSDAVPVSSDLPRPAPLFPSTKPFPRDRYGFKKSNQYVTESAYDAWNQEYTLYLDRRKKKWIEFMGREGLLVNRQIDKEIPVRFPARSDKTKRYIRKGIPPEWRGSAWFWYAGGPERLRRHPDLYRDLVKKVEAGDLNENDREHIERDLFRTFPDNIRFKPDCTPDQAMVRDPSNQSTQDTTSSATLSAHDSVLSNTIPNANIETPLIHSLRRVLQAFAIHYPSVGYCQSLNFLAALLLLLLSGDEEKSFHLLCILTSVHLPGTHGPTLEGANVDIAVLMSLLQEHLPAVWSRVNDTNSNPDAIPSPSSRTNPAQSASPSSSPSPTSPSSPRPQPLPTVSLATTSWFMSVFVGTLPIESTLRLWDVLFYEGSKTLFRAALALFRLAGPHIAPVRDPMEVFQLVQSLPRGLLDANRVVETAFGTASGMGKPRGRTARKGFCAVSQKGVEERRRVRREAMQQQRRAEGRGEEGKVGAQVGGGEDEGGRGRGVKEGGRTGSGLKRAVSRARLRRGKKEKEGKV
ncbi:MAG: hypothetical protein M1822_001056 [Bathelium mastoideum]|nr:MAG: hypothetical protein M1822_001056 [Bathelium mastoideum]